LRDPLVLKGSPDPEDTITEIRESEMAFERDAEITAEGKVVSVLSKVTTP
jgi:hypothetical protein